MALYIFHRYVSLTNIHWDTRLLKYILLLVRFLSYSNETIGIIFETNDNLSKKIVDQKVHLWRVKSLSLLKMMTPNVINELNTCYWKRFLKSMIYLHHGILCGYCLAYQCIRWLVPHPSSSPLNVKCWYYWLQSSIQAQSSFQFLSLSRF